MPGVDRGEATVDYETAGEGEPLVFVHGAWASRRMWDPQFDRFADDRTVLAVDLRGHGRTGRTRRGSYGIRLFAEDLRAVLEREGIDDPVICGLSMGGHVAMTYATEYPVDALILAGSTRTVPPVPLGRLGRRVMPAKSVLHWLIRSMGVRRYHEALLAGIRATEGHPWVGLKPETRRYVRWEIDRFETNEYLKVFDALYDYRPPDLSGLDVPTLLVHGDHEATSVVRQNRVLAARLGAQRVKIPAAGHLLNLDNPRPFNAGLATFLGVAEPSLAVEPQDGKGVTGGAPGPS